MLASHVQLQEDPIFVNIKQYEQDRGLQPQPKEFSYVLDQMLNGSEGSRQIQCARRGTRKGEYTEGIKYESLPLEYFYAPVLKGEFSVALKLAETDKVCCTRDYSTVQHNCRTLSMFALFIPPSTSSSAFFLMHNQTLRATHTHS